MYVPLSVLVSNGLSLRLGLGLARARHLEGLLELGFCRLDPSIGWVKPQAWARLELGIWRLDPSLVLVVSSSSCDVYIPISKEPISYLIKTYETTFLGSATLKMQLVINTNSLFLMPSISKEMANLDRDSLLFCSLEESEIEKKLDLQSFLKFKFCVRNLYPERL